MRNLKLEQVISANKTELLQDVKDTPGLHLMGDLYDCACADAYLYDASCLTRHCLRLVRDVGLTVVGQNFHQFGANAGVTGVIVLAESHMSVHTWPEKRYVTVDVFVCNYTKDNRKNAQQLYDALTQTFLPLNKTDHRINRS